MSAAAANGSRPSAAAPSVGDVCMARNSPARFAPNVASNCDCAFAHALTPACRRLSPAWGLRCELPVRLSDECCELQRVANTLIARRGIARQSEEIEVYLARPTADERAQPTVEEAARIPSECRPCSVLRDEAASDGDVGARPALVTRLLARPQEHSRRASTVADSGLGNDNGHGQEASRIFQKVRQVELAVVGVEEACAAGALRILR